jgi:hypothetical protein
MFDGFFDQYSIANGYYDPALDEEDEGALSPKQQRQRRARMIQNPDAAVMPPSLAMGSPPLGLPPMPNNTTPGIVAGAGQPPVIGTPKGPAVMTSPTSAAILPDVIPRREGVTLNDKMRGIYATMGAMGTPTFNSQYAGIQDRLLQKDLEDDAFNQKMDLLTLPSYEIDKATGNMVTKPAQYVKTQDGWKLNSDTKPAFKEGASASGAGLSGLTPEQRALIKNATGDNADTMLGFFLGQNAGIIPKNMAFETFVSSPLNANQGETSKSFNRNSSIFSDNGFTDGQSRSLAMLAENGGLEIVKNTDTGEIKAIDPVTKESFVIEDYETGLQKIVGAASRKQDATNRSDLNKERVTTITTRLDEIDQKLGKVRNSDEVSQYWIDQLEAKDENNQYVIDYGKDFGWLNSLMSDYFGVGSPEFSGLSADSIYEALQNLEITNLSPVSNFEFKQVMKLFANGSLGTREQALAVLKRAQARADREQGESQRKYDNELDGLKRLQGDTGPEYLDYQGRKLWITDDEARSRYGRTTQ